MSRKKLTKSNTNIVITGTLAGIAEYFGIDPIIIRIIYAVIIFIGFGSPILLYILLALIIPRKIDRTSNNYHGFETDNSYHKHNKQKNCKDVTHSIDDDQ